MAAPEGAAQTRSSPLASPPGGLTRVLLLSIVLARWSRKEPLVAVAGVRGKVSLAPTAYRACAEWLARPPYWAEKWAWLIQAADRETPGKKQENDVAQFVPGIKEAARKI